MSPEFDAGGCSVNDWRNEVRLVVWKYALSSVASTVAETATFPLDLTKTRLQIQGEHANITITHAPIKRQGMLRTAASIVQEEGLTKLWQGLPPAIYRHFVYTGVRMGSYEQIRECVLGRNRDGTFPVWKAVFGGLAAGTAGQFAASPMDLVKVQMQMEGKRRREGHPPRVQGVWHALTETVKSGGIRGLWAGCVPNVQRAALVNMGDLATYDSAKQAILCKTTLKDNWVCHALSSIMSGFVAAILGTPADVVKTRIMNQPRDKNNVGLYYKSSLDCLMKAVRKEGFSSLYKGFIPTWSRMAPWSLTFWISFEKIRQITGAGSF